MRNTDTRLVNFLRSGTAGLASAVFVAATLLASTAPAAQQTPETLMRKIMASYREDAGDKGMLGQSYFDPALTKLDEDNGKLFDGVDVLDADPVCQCQDVGGKYRYTVRRAGSDRYVATVSREGVKGSWQVIWKRIGGRWLIYDVVDDGGSVRGLLERHNNCAREKIAHHQGVEPCGDLK